MDDIEIAESEYSAQASSSAAYYISEQGTSQAGEIVFSPDLGLAVEQPPGNCTLE
jgi:hypothetical protein